MRLVLWDESRRQMISFRQLRRDTALLHTRQALPSASP
jgi:hypothetical protein